MGVINARLGDGVYGEVFGTRPHDTSGSELALKAYSEIYDMGLAHSTVREVSFIKQLRFSGITPIYITLLGNPRKPVLVMEKCATTLYNSGSLGRDGGVSMSLADSLRLYTRLLKILTTLQTNGILHRDIKPSNILIDKQGEYKLGDFGLARWVSTSTRKTHTGDMQTLWYRAPEVLFGLPYSHSADLWSMAMSVLHARAGSVLPWQTDVENDAKKLMIRYWGCAPVNTPLGFKMRQFCAEHSMPIVTYTADEVYSRIIQPYCGASMLGIRISSCLLLLPETRLQITSDPSLLIYRSKPLDVSLRITGTISSSVLWRNMLVNIYKSNSPLISLISHATAIIRSYYSLNSVVADAIFGDTEQLKINVYAAIMIAGKMAGYFSRRDYLAFLGYDRCLLGVIENTEMNIVKSADLPPQHLYQRIEDMLMNIQPYPHHTVERIGLVINTFVRCGLIDWNATRSASNDVKCACDITTLIHCELSVVDTNPSISQCRMHTYLDNLKAIYTDEWIRRTLPRFAARVTQ